MSYCRFSSDDYGCDVYVYEDALGFVTHVANNRLRFDEPLPPRVSFQDEDAWVARMVLVQKRAETAPREPIAMPHAGETFVDPTAEALITRLEDLVRLGYRIPTYVFDVLRNEIAEG